MLQIKACGVEHALMMVIVLRRLHNIHSALVFHPPWDFARQDIDRVMISSSTKGQLNGGGIGTMLGGDGIPMVVLTATWDSKKDVGCRKVVRCGLVSTQING